MGCRGGGDGMLYSIEGRRSVESSHTSLCCLGLVCVCSQRPVQVFVFEVHGELM